MADNRHQELCKLTEIPDSGSKEFTIDGHSLFAVRVGEQAFVYLNSCPHTGMPLNWQPDQFMNYEKNFIQCAIHAAIFEPNTGLCVAGPCNGDKLDKIPCNVEDGRLIIQLPVVFDE